MDKFTVKELADAARQKFPGKFNDFHDDEVARAQLQMHPDLAGQVDMRTFQPSSQLRGSPIPPPNNPADDYGGGAAIASGMARGIYKGAAQTGTSIMKLVKGAATGDFGPFDDPAIEPEIQKGLEANNLPEKIGKGAEQVGEFAAGEGLATAGAKAVLGATKVPRVLAAAGRVARGAAVGGTVAAADGADPTTGAVLGGAGAAIGEGLSAAAKSPLVEKLVEGANKSYAKTLGATKETMKNMATKVIGGYEVAGEKVPGLVERGVKAWTRKGLSVDAAKEVGNFGEQIDNLWSSIPAGEKVEAAPIKSALAEAKAKFTETGPAKPTEIPFAEVQPGEKVLSIDHKNGTATVERSETAVLEPAATRNLTRMEKMVDTLTDEHGQVDVRSLRKAKGVFDQIVSDKGGYAGKSLSIADSGGVLARKEAANSFREVLADKYPDIAKLNREFHFWSQVQDVVDETLKRTSSQSQPMGQQLAKVAGTAAMGHAGAAKAVMTGEAMGLLRKVSTSAGWNTKVAAASKIALADALASGQMPRVVKSLRSIAFGLGISATTSDTSTGGGS